MTVAPAHAEPLTVTLCACAPGNAKSEAEASKVVSVVALNFWIFNVVLSSIKTGCLSDVARVSSLTSRSANYIGSRVQNVSLLRDKNAGTTTSKCDAQCLKKPVKDAHEKVTEVR